MAEGADKETRIRFPVLTVIEQGGAEEVSRHPRRKEADQPVRLPPDFES